MLPRHVTVYLAGAVANQLEVSNNAKHTTTVSTSSLPLHYNSSTTINKSLFCTERCSKEDRTCTKLYKILGVLLCTAVPKRRGCFAHGPCRYDTGLQACARCELQGMGVLLCHKKQYHGCLVSADVVQAIVLTMFACPTLRANPLRWLSI